MSSRASRPRPVSTRSRRQRLAAGAVLASTGLLGTYLAAIRPQPTYASQGSGIGSGQAFRPTAGTGLCAPFVDDTTVYDDTALRAAIAQSADDSVICIGADITVSAPLQVDDTTLTLVGDDSSITLSGGGVSGILRVDFRGVGDDTLTVSSLTFTEGNAAKGGGIYLIGDLATDDTTHNALVIEDSVFTDDSAVSGGAVYARSLKSVSIADTSFTANSASGNGAGAVDIRRVAEVDVVSSTFDGNRSYASAFVASAAGGLFTLLVDEVTVTDSQFVENRSPIAQGGAFKVEGASVGSTVTVADTDFIRNYSGHNGGAVVIRSESASPDDTTTFTNVTATDDSAVNNGGALYVNTDSPVVLDRVAFNGSQSGNTGGALFLIGGDGVSGIGPMEARIVDTSFTDTIANDGTNGWGGAVFAQYAEAMTIEGSTFTGSQAHVGGGAIYTIAMRDVSITDSTIADGSAGALGGAARLTNMQGPLEVSGTTISGNTAQTSVGGGLSVAFGVADTATIVNSTIVDNSAPGGGGGGIQISDGSNGADLSLDFVTLTGNSAGGDGGGIRLDDSVAATVTNSIVAGNSAASSGDDVWVSANTTLDDSYSLFASATSVAGIGTINTGAGVVFGAPLLNGLADNGGPTLTMLPMWDSPAFEAGDPSWAAPPANDQRGTGYTRDAGGRVSMGAIQGRSAAPPPPPTPVYPPSAPVDVTGTPGDGEATVSWSAPASSGSFPVTDYQVVLSPGGATCMATAPVMSCTVEGLANGTEYTATVRALNGAGWGAASASSEPFTPSGPPPPVTKSIQIVGTRGEVRGRKGIIVTGTSTGLAMGAILRPWLRFPGQTSYAEGNASILVDAAGEFTWERRTGKKIYVFVKTEDGTVKSNRLVIDR